MSFAMHILCSLLGAAAAGAIFRSLGPKRRAWVPPLGWWICIALGVVVWFYGMSYSTAPSLAKRVTAMGKISNFVQRGSGRDTYFGFQFVPLGGGLPLDMETLMHFPYWDTSPVNAGRVFRVVYLSDANSFLKNEVIDIEIVSGRDAGFHDSLDARPVGKWLAIPIGGLFGFFGFFGLKYMEDDAAAAALDEEPESV